LSLFIFLLLLLFGVVVGEEPYVSDFGTRSNVGKAWYGVGLFAGVPPYMFGVMFKTPMPYQHSTSSQSLKHMVLPPQQHQTTTTTKI